MESAASGNITTTTLPLAPSLSASSTANTLTTVNFDITNNNETGSLTMLNEITYTLVGGGSSANVNKNASGAADAVNVDTTLTSLANNTTYVITAINNNQQSKSSAASSSRNESTLPVAPSLSAETASTLTTVNFNTTNSNSASTLDISGRKITHSPTNSIAQPVVITLAGANKNSDAANIDTQLTGLAPNITYTITGVNINSASMDSASSSGTTATTLPTAPSLSASSTASTLSAVSFDVDNNKC